MIVNASEIKESGLDADKVQSAARRIASAAKSLEKMGVQIFANGTGGDGFSSLIYFDKASDEQGGPLVLAEITEGSWDGGDPGDNMDNSDFFKRLDLWARCGGRRGQK